MFSAKDVWLIDKELNHPTYDKLFIEPMLLTSPPNSKAKSVGCRYPKSAVFLPNKFFQPSADASPNFPSPLIALNK
jgi:hypothetical protein